MINQLMSHHTASIVRFRLVICDGYIDTGLTVLTDLKKDELMAWQ